MATLSTASGFPYPATSETPDVQRNLKALADYLEAKLATGNTWTPTLGGFTPGNGVATGKWFQIGKLVYVDGQFTFGTTSAAAAAAPTLSLPVAANMHIVYPGLMRGLFYKNVSGPYQTTAVITAATTVTSYIPGTNDVWQLSSTTLPFTWATSDVIRVSGLYVAA